jgi:hypothetical protein
MTKHKILKVSYMSAMMKNAEKIFFMKNLYEKLFFIISNRDIRVQSFSMCTPHFWLLLLVTTLLVSMQDEIYSTYYPGIT